ncbi:MAG: cytochrome c biogenesis protein CcsA [Planctomycetaceae bacterium]|nr:cytochrome c biogenesis protein CcsA [Planctomycetaceae bacterium]
MGVLSKVQISCFIFSYVAALICEVTLVLRNRRGVAGSFILRTAMLCLTLAGLIAHTAYLINRSLTVGLPPLLTSGQDWLLVLAWAGVAGFLILTLSSPRIAHGVFMLPAVLALSVTAVLSSDSVTGDLHALALRRWGMLHAASLVIGVGCVLASNISALMYLLHYQKLRGKSSWLYRLQFPSLEQLTRVTRGCVIAAVAMLTIGLATGFILFFLAQDAQGHRLILWSDPTIVTTLMFWAVMVVMVVRLLTGRHQSGKAVAQLAALGGAFLLLTILGPMILASGGGLKTFHGSASPTDEPANSSPPHQAGARP